MTNFFSCKYPIIAAPMNQVSDIKLAIACFEAGILPSLSIYSFVNKFGMSNHSEVDYQIKTFQDHTGSSNILLSLSKLDLLTESFFKIVEKNQIKFLELIAIDTSPFTGYQENLYSNYKNLNVFAFSKRTNSSFEKLNFAKGVIFKGKDGAGRSEENLDPINEIFKIQRNHPDLKIIMSGGIGCLDDVKRYLSIGCIGVAIGTLLAASEESCLSYETKIKIIESSWKDVTRMQTGAFQNSLIFSKIEEDDFNHTKSLKLGIQNASMGHIFAGKGIDFIRSIRPVKDIIYELVDGL
jgi:NAD(P)H-dependent flavin oxidoreductase YrpB (nitropropane dioxygenase family)